MGMLVTGSTISPLMTISICIVNLACSRHASERTGVAALRSASAAGCVYKVGPA